MMRFSPVTDRLSGLGGAKWALHARARRMKAEGRDIIELTIGEPDLPCADDLIEAAVTSLRARRLGYSNGRGEPVLLRALSDYYSARSGRLIGTDQFLALPGTQTALYAALQVIAGPGDEVLVGDPMYATYEGVIAASGAQIVPVPLFAEHGFCLQPADVLARITPKSRVLFLNSPHNPSGAILSRDEIAALCQIAKAANLWILSDEVYADMIFPGERFTSPLDLPEYAERVVVTSSISKSHAAPGLRSGWCLGSPEFCARALPLAETMLFGNQPFIADATAAAIAAPSLVARQMAGDYARRAALVAQHLDGVAGITVSRPKAGMFALIDIRRSGLSGMDFADLLLDRQSVAVMPGESFGQALSGWLRLSLTQPDAVLLDACGRIVTLARELQMERGKA
jgi:arginine:pyruvate transaminase